MTATTAVYDIAARTVYLPDGTQLEAHPGLGGKMDDVRYAHVRMQGVTPPHIYYAEAARGAVPRRARVAADADRRRGEDFFGRDGLLAHTYMLGGTGQSNGCVSFKDYYAFLDAYRNKGIRKDRGDREGELNKRRAGCSAVVPANAGTHNRRGSTCSSKAVDHLVLTNSAAA